MSNKDFYHKKQQGAEANQVEAKRRLRQVTFLRLAAFLLIIYSIYLSVVVSFSFMILLTGLIIGFLQLMKVHSKADFKHAFATELNKISSAGINPYYKESSGEKYEDGLHPYCSDFDVFGKQSLFQYINKTETVNGEKFLASLLLNPLKDSDKIEVQQQAVKELSQNPDFLIQLRAYNALIGHNDSTDILLKTWLDSPSYYTRKKFIPVLLWLIPAFSVAGIIVAVLFKYYTLIGFAILLNWFFAGIDLKRTNQLHALVGKQKNMLENFSKLNSLVSRQQFSSAKLISLQQSYTQSTTALNQLSRLAATFDQRLNTMLGPIFNSLFLFDLQCVYRIEKWKEKNSTIMKNWLNDAGEMEALVTLGTFAFDHDRFVYPELKTNGIYLDASNIVHPLIGEKEGVSNSFSYDENNKVFIITGSNMSGKSTFLRTLGTSILTGMIGLPVNAERFIFSPVKLLSSMRIADSLQDSTSYFYAELKRLKLIIDETEKPGLPAVLFIDEMLKGTNSKEKLDGSIAVIEKLVTKPCVSFIATHDLALGSLEQRFPGQVKNHSFESEIVNNNLVFDYKIKAGVAASTNATFLLKKMEIV